MLLFRVFLCCWKPLLKLGRTNFKSEAFSYKWKPFFSIFLTEKAAFPYNENVFRDRNNARSSDMTELICHLIDHKISSIVWSFYEQNIENLVPFQVSWQFINKVEITNPKDVYLPRIITNNVCGLFSAGRQFFCLQLSLETTLSSTFSHNFQSLLVTIFSHKVSASRLDECSE